MPAREATPAREAKPTREATPTWEAKPTRGATPTWEAEPTAPDEHHSRHQPLPVRWIVAVATVVLVGAGVAAAIVMPRLLSKDDHPAPASTTTAPIAAPATVDTTDPATTDPTDTSEQADTADPTETLDPTTDPPAPSGIVAIGPGVTDERAPGVAAMFDTYFGGVNDKNYDAVGSVLDPAGSVDPADPAEMNALARGTRSTTDSDIALTGLADTSGGLLAADVTFVSHQTAGDGPRGRSSETCTHWTIRYTVSNSGAYRIRKSKATSRPCA
jgi:hypothetical protein